MASIGFNRRRSDLRSVFHSEMSMKRLLAILACGVLSLPGCKRSGAGDARVVLAVGGKTAVAYLPLTIAEQQGFFRAEGLDVEIQDLQGGAKALQALVGGSADVVIGYYDHTIQMQAKNKDVIAIALLARYPGLVLAVRKDLAHINSAAGLKGLKVGVTAPGSSTHFMADYLLSKEGLDASEIAVVGIGVGGTAVAAVEQKQVDALVNMDPTITVLESRALIKILADTRTEHDTNQIYGGEYPGASLYTTREYLDRNPATAQRLVNAIVRALRWIGERTPDQIASTLPESYLGSEGGLYARSLAKSFAVFSPDGRFSESAPAKVLQVLSLFDEGVEPGKVDLSRTYTNSLVERAKQASTSR